MKNRGGEQWGLDPLPPGFNPPNPSQIFLPTFSGTPARNADFLPPPIWPPPPHLVHFSSKTLYPRPPNPRAPDPGAPSPKEQDVVFYVVNFVSKYSYIFLGLCRSASRTRRRISEG